MTKDEIINKLIELSEDCLPAVRGELLGVIDAVRGLEDCEDYPCGELGTLGHVDIKDSIDEISGINELLRGVYTDDGNDPDWEAWFRAGKKFYLLVNRLSETPDDDDEED